MSRMSELHIDKQKIQVLEQPIMNQVTVTNNYNQEKIELIKNTIAMDATNLELQLFIEQCKRTGLDPITRQIYFIKDKKSGKVQIQTSIDGFRLVAERSGEYQGQTPPQWCGEDGKFVDVWLKKTPPSACRIGVWKTNFREPLYAIAIFDEYAQKKADGTLQFMWAKMPSLMIAKVAESLALRKAFPNDLSGLYTADEMAQAENVAVDSPIERNSTGAWSEPKKAIPTRSTAVFSPDQPESLGVGDNVTQDFSPARTATVDQPIDQRPDGVTGFSEFDNYRIGFGKYKDHKLVDINPQDLLSYYNYLNKQILDSGKPAGQKMEELLTNIEQYLNIK